jgi:glycosyltransferase involved in cell wall biosynthesis
VLDASIIHLKKDELFTTVIPSKLFECMGMAIPVLHGVEGESAGIVEREDVGLLFEPESPEALVAGLRRLSDDPELLARYRANGPVSAKRYDRSSLASDMLQILKEQAGMR